MLWQEWMRWRTTCTMLQPSELRGNGVPHRSVRPGRNERQQFFHYLLTAISLLWLRWLVHISVVDINYFRLLYRSLSKAESMSSLGKRKERDESQKTSHGSVILSSIYSPCV